MGKYQQQSAKILSRKFEKEYTKNREQEEALHDGVSSDLNGLMSGVRFDAGRRRSQGSEGAVHHIRINQPANAQRQRVVHHATVIVAVAEHVPQLMHHGRQ